MPVSPRIIQLIISVQAAPFQQQTKAGIKKGRGIPTLQREKTQRRLEGIFQSSYEA